MRLRTPSTEKNGEQMRLDRRLRNSQLARDQLVGKPAGSGAIDIDLTGRQTCQPVLGLDQGFRVGSPLVLGFGVGFVRQEYAACQHLLQCAHHGLGAVTLRHEAGRAEFNRALDEGGFAGSREDHDSRHATHIAKALDRLFARATLEIPIQQHQVMRRRGREAQCAFDRAGGVDLYARDHDTQQVLQTLKHHHMIVDHQYAHRHLVRIEQRLYRVPPPARPPPFGGYRAL